MVRAGNRGTTVRRARRPAAPSDNAMSGGASSPTARTHNKSKTINVNNKIKTINPPHAHVPPQEHAGGCPGTVAHCGHARNWTTRSVPSATGRVCGR